MLSCPLYAPLPHLIPTPQRAILGGSCLWIRSSRILTTGTTYGHWFCLSTRALLKQKHLMHDLIRWVVIYSIFHRQCHAKSWTLSSGHSTAFLHTQGYQHTHLPRSPPRSHPHQCVLPDFPGLFICTKSKLTCSNFPLPHNPARTGLLVWETNLSWVQMKDNDKIATLALCQGFQWFNTKVETKVRNAGTLPAGRRKYFWNRAL